MIDAKNLTKRYRQKTAVDNVSFSVETGRVTGFLGPNGAGKSTTMRLMLGLDRGTGQTTFDGKRLSHHARPSGIVGILLEAKAYHPTRSARQHLNILARAGGTPLRRVDEVLDVVGLHSVANKAPGKFSLGMSQRLGIAAALLGEPKYLMLDEPANGLDPEGIAWLRTFLKNYADRGNAVFVSSHLLSEVGQMADDMVVIGKGKLITSGSVEDIIAQNSERGVFVRVKGKAKLEVALRLNKLAFTRKDDGLMIEADSTDIIGKLAFQSGVPVYELSSRQATLEEAFLRLTADSSEYKKGEV